MYKEAEETIKNGLSPLARFMLGGISGLFGIMLILMAPPTDKQVYFYLYGGFCLVISLACVFKGRVRQFLGSIVGLVLAILSAWYLISQIMSGGPLFSERSGQSIFNAVLFTICFGVPGLTYVAKAKFGFGNSNK